MSDNFSALICCSFTQFLFYHDRGGYIFGNASQYAGNDLIRESGGNVVVVVIQYRLGLFGFLPGQKVKDGGALNAGLCKRYLSRLSTDSHSSLFQLVDQQFALEWVQQHVSSCYLSAFFFLQEH